LDRSDGSMLGTVRIENLPMTRAGMTVFAPGAENAPSIPWRDREGYRHLLLPPLLAVEIPVHQGVLLVVEKRCFTTECVI